MENEIIRNQSKACKQRRQFVLDVYRSVPLAEHYLAEHIQNCPSCMENEIIRKAIESRSIWPREQDDEITYRAYRHNRRAHPAIHPYQWEKVYGKITAKMEVRLALEEYAEQCAATGTVMHHLGRECDKETHDQ